MPAVQTARDPLRSLQQFTESVASQELTNREPRYLFFAGDEPTMAVPGGLAVASPVIPNKVLWRCMVTPALSVPVRMRAVDIPEGRELDGTRDDKGLAAMLLPCGPEVDELLAQYGHPDTAQWQKRWGLVELEELRGMQPRDVAKLNLNATFFPDWPEIPHTNKEVRDHLRAKLEEPKIANDPLLKAIGERMIAAVEQAQAYQTKLIQQGNMRVTYPDSNDGFKPGFDSKDELFAVRSGVGLAVNSLRGNQSDAAASSIGAVIEKVMEKFQPQQAAIDPNQIAAIVAATMQAMGNQKPAEEAPKPVAKLEKKAA